MIESIFVHCTISLAKASLPGYLRLMVQCSKTPQVTRNTTKAGFSGRMQAREITMNNITPRATTTDVTKMVTDAAATQGAQAQKLIEEGTVKARAALETGMAQAQDTAAKMTRTAEDAAEFGRGNFEAFSRAAQVYFAGVQDIGRQFVANLQGMSEHAMEGAKALSSVKSVKEMTDLQSSLARTAFEKSLADANALRTQMTKLTEAAFAPLTARVTVATEKFSRPIAA